VRAAAVPELINTIFRAQTIGVALDMPSRRETGAALMPTVAPHPAAATLWRHGFNLLI